MSLFKQLLLAISLFMLVVFSGNFIVTLESSRDQSNNQLLSHAQDAATALGVALTPNVNDPAMIELMVSAIFDSGYYKKIRIVDLKNGKIILERSAAASIPNVPVWFVDLVDVIPQTGEATIMRGWQQAARVEVTSDPIFAVQRLWDNTLGNLLWMLSCSLICLGAGVLLLRKLLQPLNYLAKQSEAITHREFLTLSELPKTPELRRVIGAMNLMATKLKSLFEEQAIYSERLHNEAYLDSQTGIANRRAFDMQLQARLSDADTAPRYLMLIRVQDLGGLNQRFGGPHTDKLLLNIANLLTAQKEKYAFLTSTVARIRGGEFALLCPGVTHSEMLELSHSLSQKLMAFYATGMSDQQPVAYTSMVPFSAGDNAQSLLIQADRLLVEVETHTEHQVVPTTDVATATEDQHLWFVRLEHALENQQFQLVYQPVVDCQKPHNILHYKVLSRIVDEQGNIINAGRFLPWIHRFGWSHRLDRVMLKMTLNQLKTTPGKLALSISGSSVASASTVADLLNPLKYSPQLASQLILELDENQLPGPNQMAAFVKAVSQHRCSLGLQHFGSRVDMIGHLSQWRLAWLKIDSSYIRNIDQESDKRLFIEVLCNATRSIDLPLIAERVETQGELKVLQELGIDGAMGQLLGEPAPLS